MGQKVEAFAENIAEAGVACLVTMVQGNILALGLSHWIIASQTGLVAGTAAAAAITFIKIQNRWVIAAILGLLTFVVDYFMHPGMFGGAVTEALVTGTGAAVLSWIVGTILARRRRKQAIQN